MLKKTVLSIKVFLKFWTTISLLAVNSSTCLDQLRDGGMMLSCLVRVTCCPNCKFLFNLMASPMSSMEIQPTPLHATSWNLFEESIQPFNTRMSKVRVNVEWGFGKICQNFADLDQKKKNENSTPASRKMLPSCYYSDQLSYLALRISNKLIFRAGTTNT